MLRVHSPFTPPVASSQIRIRWLEKRLLISARQVFLVFSHLSQCRSASVFLSKLSVPLRWKIPAAPPRLLTMGTAQGGSVDGRRVQS